MSEKQYDVNQGIFKDRWAILQTDFIHLVQPHMASRELVNLCSSITLFNKGLPQPE